MLSASSGASLKSVFLLGSTPVLGEPSFWSLGSRFPHGGIDEIWQSVWLCSFSESERVIRPDIGGKATHKAWEFPPAHIGTEELATVLQQWKTRSSDGRLSSGSPGGIFAAWEGIDVHSPLLDPSYTPQINPLPQAIGGLGSFTDNDFDAAQLVQQYTMGQP